MRGAVALRRAAGADCGAMGGRCHVRCAGAAGPNCGAMRGRCHARSSAEMGWLPLCRFCEEFLRGLEPKTKPRHTNLRAHGRNGTTSLPLRAQCAALEQIVATANATSLYRMLRRSLRREKASPTAARPLTRHSKMAIRTTCSRRKCLRKTQFKGPEECGRFEGADRTSPPDCAVTDAKV